MVFILIYSVYLIFKYRLVEAAHRFRRSRESIIYGECQEVHEMRGEQSHRHPGAL